MNYISLYINHPILPHTSSIPNIITKRESILYFTFLHLQTLEECSVWHLQFFFILCSLTFISYSHFPKGHCDDLDNDFAEMLHPHPLTLSLVTI